MDCQLIFFFLTHIFFTFLFISKVTFYWKACLSRDTPTHGLPQFAKNCWVIPVPAGTLDR
jgi:hypothetical protein